jgi:hypothetical protein
MVGLVSEVAAALLDKTHTFTAVYGFVLAICVFVFLWQP